MNRGKSRGNNSNKKGTITNESSSRERNLNKIKGWSVAASGMIGGANNEQSDAP